MTERSVTHATFVVERTYEASPARAFAAWAASLASQSESVQRPLLQLARHRAFPDGAIELVFHREA